MAITENTYTGNNYATNFSFSFPYLSESDVKVSLDDVDQPTTAYSFANATEISFVTAPGTGVAIRIYRQTAQDAPPATFFAGSAIRAQDLNENFLQQLYVAQETANIAGDLTTGGIAPGSITSSLLASSSVTSDKIVNGTIVDADISSSAEIAVSKLADGSARQLLQTDAAGTGVEWTSNVDVPGTLDVTGNVTVPNLNGGPLAGMRNAIINGNFDIWQRGTSFTGTEYGADRWLHGRLGTTHTVTRQPFTIGQTDVPNEPSYFCRTIVSSVAGTGHYSALIHKIEGVRSFAGQQVTVSFWAKADSNKYIAVDFLQYFGTSPLNNPLPSSDVSAIGATKIAIGTTWQKVTVTVNIPSIAGKTIGTDNNDTLILYIWFDASTQDYLRTDSLGHQSGTFDIAQVQVERGPNATPFERRSYGQELALCQRYYETGDWDASGITYSSNGDTRSNLLPFAVTKRATPAVTVNTTSISIFAVGPNGSGVNLNGSIGSISSSKNGIGLSLMTNYANIAATIGGGDYSWGMRCGIIYYATAEL